MFFFLLVFSLLSYFSIDPLKSCLFLIMFMIFLLFFLSLNKNVWFSYFICLIFLSGILAILVYFTTLSVLSLKVLNFNILLYFFFIFCFFICCFLFSYFTNLNKIYFNFYFIFIFWILSFLILFFNFVSFMISFMKGLRKF